MDIPGNQDVDNTVEIGGQRMTQAQFDAARFPLLRNADETGSVPLAVPLAPRAPAVDMFIAMLKAQHALQVLSMKDGDPRLLDGVDRMTFVTWNAYALEDELHEATAETGWKPWASSNHINGALYTKELVDGWHFFMNLLIVGSAEVDMSLDDYGAFFFKMYMEKNAINAKRMADGYDGVSTKCPNCKREMSETDASLHKTLRDGRVACSPRCALHV